MNSVFETLRSYYLEHGSIMPSDFFKKEFSSQECPSDELVNGVFQFDDYLNRKRLEKEVN